MISKFSVKKAYTVVVGIVLVLILGIVAYTKMTVDLLPAMELPYAIVMTTYPGASPEAVEAGVTKPIEQAVASIDNIENIQSISSENVLNLVRMPIWMQRPSICVRVWTRLVAILMKQSEILSL